MESGGEIILLNQHFKINLDEINKKSWESGLLQQVLWLQHKLYPDTNGERWREQIKFSFNSQIMTPVTSYLVVENDAQKAMLKRKQEQVLKGKEFLDLHEEEPEQMSEPGLILLIFVPCAILWIKRRGYFVKKTGI